MADPITAAIAWAGAEMGSAALIMYATEIASVITFTAAIAGSSAYARQQQRKARAAYNASLKDREVTFRSGIAPRRIIYGRDKVGGTLAYVQSTGDKGEYLHLVIALAAHECDAIEEVWFGDVKLPDPDGSGFITSGDFAKLNTEARHSTVTSSAGGVATLPAAASRVLSVTTPFVGSGIDTTGGDLITGWAHTAGATTITGLPASASVVVDYEVQVAEALVRIKKHLGAPGQVADADLVAESGGKWTSAHKGTGLCYLYLRLKFDPDVFASFDPSSITAVVRGKRVYDYRTSTTAWTDNAALIVADWLRDQTFGLRASAAEVPSAEVIAEANICDELVTIGTGGETQPRYTFNGSFTTDQAPIDVLEDLLSGMAGTCIWIQGRWLLRAGAYRTPTVTLTADDLAGSTISVQPHPSRTELINAVRVTYRDPTQAWAEVQAPLVTNATYIAQDGGTQIVRSITMPGAMDGIRAQRMGKIELERARQAVTARLTTSLRGYNLAPTDTSTLQLSRYGWSGGKVFEARERALNPDGTITYLLRETAASVWAWALGEATVLDPAPDTELPSPWARPAAPASLAATSGTARLADGSVVARVRLSWTQHPDAFVTRGGRIDVRWRRSGSDAWQDVAPVDGAETGAYLTGVPEGNVIVAQARAVNAAGRASDWATVAHLVDTVTAIDWRLLNGRPAQFRVAAVGLSSTSQPIAAGLYDPESGATLAAAGYMYRVVKIARATGLVTDLGAFNTLAGGSAPADMAAALNAIGSDHVVVVYSNDEPRGNRLSAGLDAAMYRHGASRAVFGSPQFKYRSAYVLVGIGGCGEGNGFESYQGDVDADTDAWCDIAFQLQGGSLLVTGTGATPRTLVDYGAGGLAYLSSVDATEIVDGAATRVVTASVAGPISVPRDGAYVAMAAISTVTVTNPDATPRRVVLHVSFSIDGTANGATGVWSTFGVADGDIAAAAPGQSAELRVAPGVSHSSQQAFTATFLMAASATVTFTVFHCSILSSYYWSSLNVSKLSIVAEVIRK